MVAHIKYVFIVGERDDELHHKFSAARNDRSTGPPICVLPVDAVVLLVQADDIRCYFAAAVSANDDAVEVL
jgi:hypothetical protein